MPLDLALAAFLHVLVFVYWLGGDLGAFVSAGIVMDSKRAPAARAAAAQILANVDMAPRTALILAAPTGLLLAQSRGLVDLAPGALWALTAAAGAWLALAWFLHLSHVPPGSLWRKADLAIRWAALLGLAAFALLASDAAGHVRAKAGLLAAAIGLGLVIRALLAPFGAAFGAIMKDGSTPDAEAALRGSLGKARVAVVALWAVILTSAFLGVSGGAGWTS